ncbi:hypothetical protein AVEN_129713-1 [Araneus ventricosus]|uniref:Uncharacterized protein n=1 Tax=Araneus ventricosus TaxID=182803 RepID=A0A4Y2DJK9_ARAVE|nr:hypothetical protein AVEN_129713-1 [Araneus ventricosus]
MCLNSSGLPGSYCIVQYLKRECAYCYEHGMSLPGNNSLMVGKRHLHRFLLTIEGGNPMIPDLGDFGDKTKILKNARIFEISFIGAEIQISPEISITSHPIGMTINTRQVDRLGTSLQCARLRGITWSFDCSASWKADEMCVIESAVTVILAICCLFALLICTRAFVPVTCASCFPEYL